MYAANIDRASQMEFFGFGWRYYNSLKNKAMEREFSWAGLFISLSVAFFVVIVSSFAMSMFYKSVTDVSWSASMLWPESSLRAEISAPAWPMMVVNGMEMPRVEKLNLG